MCASVLNVIRNNSDNYPQSKLTRLLELLYKNLNQLIKLFTVQTYK